MSMILPKKYEENNKLGDTGIVDIKFHKKPPTATFHGYQIDDSVELSNANPGYFQMQIFTKKSDVNVPIGITDIKFTPSDKPCPSGYVDGRSHYANDDKNFFDTDLYPCVKKEYGKPFIDNVAFISRDLFDSATITSHSILITNDKKIVTYPQSKSTVKNHYLEIEQTDLANNDLVMKEFCNKPKTFNALLPSCREWCLKNPGECDHGVRYACNSDLMTSDDNTYLFDNYCSCVNPALDGNPHIYDVSVSQGRVSMCHTGTCRNGGYKTFNQANENCQIVDCSMVINNINTGLQVDQDIIVKQTCGIYNTPIGDQYADENITVPEDTSTSWLTIILIFIILLVASITTFFAFRFLFKKTRLNA